MDSTQYQNTTNPPGISHAEVQLQAMPGILLSKRRKQTMTTLFIQIQIRFTVI